MAVLAGCAGQRSAQNTDGIPYDEVELASRSSDPIGDLIAYRAKHGGPVSQLPGANNPLVGEALTYLGVRYRFGGTSPAAGFDCSGLVAYSAERSLGLKLPRNAAEIAGWGVSIDRSELSPGDLVFFNTLGRRYSHVGIYMGANEFVHSPSAGGVVRVENMTAAYWAKRYNGARRLSDRNVATAAR
jgi:cell wall-associated NlpC family hydrolase